ncbi:colicin E3/pyocin S6 family cytotoxin [Campylobacter ureolyticus]
MYEWDSQHGEMEIYDKQGNHKGSYNPKTKEKNQQLRAER